MDNVTLNNVARGEMVRLFNKGMDAMLANIADVDTKAEAARELTLKVKLLPTADRGEARAAVSAAVKLQPHMGSETTLYLGLEETEDGLKPVAKQTDIAQQQLGFSPREE